MSVGLCIETCGQDVLADEVVNIAVSGANSGEKISVHSTLKIAEDDVWESHLIFQADKQGRVEFATATPLEGPYSDPHPMGFLWAMSHTQIPVELPKPCLKPASPQHIAITASGENGQRGELSLTRHYVADGVRRTEVRDNGLVGTLFQPAGDGPHPVVVSFGGSEGGLSEVRAALYAAHGFSSLALAYFGVDPLPAGLREVPLEYFKGAFDYLVDEGICKPGEIAVEGGSYGGQLALLLAATFSEVGCAISYVGSGLVTASVDVEGETETTSAFTLHGKPLPYVELSLDPIDWAAPEIALAPGYLACLEDEQKTRAATITVEKSRGPILMLSAADDQMWPSRAFSEVAAARLQAANFPHYFEHVCYENAGHVAMAAPYCPSNIESQLHPVIGLNFAFGGTALGNLRASEDAWRRVLELLRSTFSAA